MLSMWPIGRHASVLGRLMRFPPCAHFMNGTLSNKQWCDFFTQVLDAKLPFFSNERMIAVLPAFMSFLCSRSHPRVNKSSLVKTISAFPQSLVCTAVFQMHSVNIAYICLHCIHNSPAATSVGRLLVWSVWHKAVE